MAFEGLGAFRASQENTKSEAKFYKPTEKGQKVQIRPLVELDKSAVNFSEKNGIAKFTREYQNPQKFWLSYVDTFDDEGASFGKEMVQKYGWFVQKDPKVEKGQHSDGRFNWNPKRWVYVPVLVKENSGDEPRVEVLQLSFNGDVAQSLITFAEDIENEGDPLRSITDRWWTYSRNNEEGFAVRYALTPKDPSDDVNVEDYDVPDVEALLNYIPYSEQAAFLQVASNVERPDHGASEAEGDYNAPSQGMESAVASAKW